MPLSGKYLLSFIWALDLQKRRARKNVGAAICRPAGIVWGRRVTPRRCRGCRREPRRAEIFRRRTLSGT